MDDQLLSLLEYEGILGALLTTHDGLVIGAAGLSGDDAETVAAAGSMLFGAESGNGEAGASADVGGGSLYVRWGDELALIVLAEQGVPGEGVRSVMESVLTSASSEFAQ